MAEKTIKEETQILKKYIQKLDSDIEMMFPWGELDLSETERLRAEGIALKYWEMDQKRFHQELQRSMDPTIPHWMSKYNVHPVSDANFKSYFTTRTPIGTEVQIPYAIQARMCPSPVSTLIILQTKAKDALKHLTEQ